jgi:hypothetical protein
VKEDDMRTQILVVSLGCAVGAAAAGPALAFERNGFAVSVLVDGDARQEYAGRGTTYVEAVRGREYTLSITNPLPTRVAVALSVDGLNTIDAKHTSAKDARKWVLGPYETIEISGWQVNQSDARRFFFTGERHSYGAYLGETQNLGVIEAAFFRERVCERRRWVEAQPQSSDGRREPMRDKAEAKSAPAPSAFGAASGAMEAESSRLSDEYAATGIGHRDEHQVRMVQLELESTPAAVLQLRYEYRPALVRLGLLPPRASSTALDRREHASGFARSFCPDPPSREW